MLNRSKKSIIHLLGFIAFFAIALQIAINLRNIAPQGTRLLFDGKALDTWFYGRGSSSAFTDRVVAINTIGTNAVPYLIQKLLKRDSRWDKFRQRLYTKLPGGIRLRFTRPPTAYEVNLEALIFLSQGKDKLNPFSEELLETTFKINSPRLQTVAFNIFESLTGNLANQDQAAAFYKKGINHSDFSIRLASALKLAEISPAATNGLPILVAALTKHAHLAGTTHLPDVSSQENQQRILNALQRISPSEAAPFLHLSIHRDEVGPGKFKGESESHE